MRDWTAFLTMALLLVLLVAQGCLSQNGNRPPIVGNDSDVHGCRASAGYSWCEEKQKCLRSWEESCTAPTPHACTMEAKLCPDGSAVGRQGPNCEFAPCPSTNASNGTVSGNDTLYGRISIGPLCPVEPCGRTFNYSQMQVMVYQAQSGNPVAHVSPNMSGNYGIALEPGRYLVNVTDEVGHSFGMPGLAYTQSVSILSGQRVEVDFDIDTGIR